MGKSVAKGTNQAVYVIAGKEESLLDAAASKLLGRLLKPEQKSVALFNPNSAEALISDVLDELRTLPFLADKRVVLLKNADKFVSANRPVLEKYFDNPSDTGVLILTVNKWDSRTKLAKKLPSIGKLIDASAPSARELPGRLVQYARDSHGKVLTINAARFLMELSGDNIVLLYREIDKLAVFANEDKNITIEHITLLTGHNRLFSAFAVIDASILGDSAKAIERLRRMFAEDKSAEYMVVGAFAFHFRRMFQAKAMLEKGMQARDIAGRLRIFNANVFFPQLRKISLQQIGAHLSRLADIDYAVKTGQAKPKVTVEQFVYDMSE